MPYDFDADRIPKKASLRDGVLNLIARRESGEAISDDEFRTALRMLVACSRRPAEDLLDKIHRGQLDTRGKTYAKYAY